MDLMVGSHQHNRTDMKRREQKYNSRRNIIRRRRNGLGNRKQAMYWLNMKFFIKGLIKTILLVISLPIIFILMFFSMAQYVGGATEYDVWIGKFINKFFDW